MEFPDIKKTPILDFLDSIGHQPVRIKYGSAWFHSPLRQEKTPSFKVDLNKNLWYDFGTGKGGNIISLVIKLRECSVAEAMSLAAANNYSVKESHFIPVDESCRIKIKYFKPLANHALIQYLKFRRVSFQFADMFLKEAYYTVHGKHYFALAFKNDLEGYELRNKFFKTGSSPKYFTTITGEDKTKINVFEGFMDFLSCCSYFKSSPQRTTIVLNSLSFLPKIESRLQNAQEINLLLDNDPAGRVATLKILELFPNAADCSSSIYPDYKDFNEFLMAKE